jgi:hypothetical protein
VLETRIAETPVNRGFRIKQIGLILFGHLRCT